MSLLEYASKFIELSRFTPAFVADEKLKMNRFEVGLNPNLKERMSVRHYVSYEDLYDTSMNVEREMKEKNEYYSQQWGNKRKGCQRENVYSQGQYKRTHKNYYNRQPAQSDMQCLREIGALCTTVSHQREMLLLWESSSSEGLHAPTTSYQSGP